MARTAVRRGVINSWNGCVWLEEHCVRRECGCFQVRKRERERTDEVEKLCMHVL